MKRHKIYIKKKRKMKEKHTQMREHGEEHTCTKEEYYYEQLCYVLQQLP
jgi:hypothetical protein